MKRFGSIFVTLTWWLSTTLHLTTFGSEGVVLNERVNVRTRPSIASEVIQQLDTGAVVTILDRINLNDPQPGEPREWFRIVIPEATELWISSEYIDTATKSVKASRLNVRAGPGQNFSVVGRIERGAVVEPIRASAGWTAIKPLAATVAYVATEFINESSTANANQIIEPDPPTQATIPVQAVASSEIPSVIIDEENEISNSVRQTTLPPPITPEEEPPVFNIVSAQSSEESLFDKVGSPSSSPAVTKRTESPITFIPIETSRVQPQPIKLNPVSNEMAEELKRIITRDGIVKRSRNIQAPTYHRLEDPRTGTTINYLYTGKLQVDLGTGPKALKPYEGRKIRVVGAEAVDARWPRIPVIEVEQLRILE
jgi:uncharacterized protein YgiM (DUF1202 family)